jgi:hypothetical protein
MENKHTKENTKRVDTDTGVLIKGQGRLEQASSQDDPLR